MDVNQRKAVEIVLNSENISREQNEEIDSFIHLRMVNFMKVDFQDRLSKKCTLFRRSRIFMKHLKSLHLTIKSAIRAREQIITFGENRNFEFKNTFYLRLVWLENQFK